ncbi:MAG: 1,4-alpha-glucan branching enzyme, partial [Thermoleophilaceae bacterium]|nr:1,4-alpha-glucan branching enzyme [Thermoleophilaceae bacterium]
MPPPGSPSPADEVARLVTGEHRDPHSVLGFHDGRVHALRPPAVAVRVLAQDGTVTDLERVHEGGPFAGGGAGGRERVPAPSRVQGRHHGRLRRRLPLLAHARRRRPGPAERGAAPAPVAGPQRHPRAHEGVEGTAFAVWAPSARSVRVVGDFNLWDGRLNPMRSLGSSGIW